MLKMRFAKNIKIPTILHCPSTAPYHIQTSSSPARALTVIVQLVNCSTAKFFECIDVYNFIVSLKWMFVLSRALELVSHSQTAFSFLFVGKKRSGYARLPWNSHGKARS